MSSSSSLFVSRQPHAPALPASSIRHLVGRIGYVTKVSIATSLGLLLLWQIAASLEVVAAMFLPSPLAVATKFVAVSREGFQNATLLEHLLASVGRVTAALVAAVILGVAVGFAMNLANRDRARGRHTRTRTLSPHPTARLFAPRNHLVRHRRIREGPRHFPRHSAVDCDRDE